MSVDIEKLRKFTDYCYRFCHVPPEQVLAVRDCQSVYHVPLLLQEQNLLHILERRLNLTKIPRTVEMKCRGEALMDKWKQLTDRHSRFHEELDIVIVGKYTSLQDSYISVVKSLEHAALSINRKLVVKWVEASLLEVVETGESPLKHHEAWATLCSASGIVVPGGFGTRGIEGKVAAAKWARENKVPYLGICLGMQTAVIEFARNVCGLHGT